MKKLSMLLVVVFLTLSCVPAFAARGGNRGSRSDSRYVYRNHRYYRSDGYWWDFGITALAVGAILASRPANGTYVVANGQTYYYCDGTYYQQVPQGYMIVQAPVVVSPPVVVSAPAAPIVQAPAREGEPVEVNVPNSDGTFTKVTLFKHQNGYKGPQGEFYPGNPTVEQLRALYGK